MTTYDDRLWSDADPDYAPGLMWRSNGYPVWRAPRRYVASGWAIKTVPLPKGSKGDGLDRDRARICREQTREMVRWFENREAGRPEAYSIGWIAAHYLHDEHSPFRQVKANTRADYRESCAYWQAAIGNLFPADLTHRKIREIEMAMKARGRSSAFIHRKFTMLRGLARYAKLEKVPGAADLSETLSDMRFQMAPKRTVAPTRAQVYAIAAAADAAGERGYATGVLIQFELILRGVDVFGQWLDADGTGGIARGKTRWQDGLTWDMVAPEAASITKVISKTAKSLPEPIEFSLAALPELRARILALAPPENRVGPLIVARGGLPYTRSGRAHAWARHRATAKVPKEVFMMDLRAGGVSEADSANAPREMLSQAAQHQNLETTARYVRGRSRAAASVIELRQNRP